MYIVTEMVQDGAYLLKCEQSGVIGNHYDGNLINMDAVENINSAILGEVVISGSNEEQDDALRHRYLDLRKKIPCNLILNITTLAPVQVENYIGAYVRIADIIKI